MTASRRASYRLKIAAVAATASISVQAWAQQGAPPATDDTAWRQRMEERLQALERENAALKAEVGKVADTRAAVMRDAEARSTAGDLTLELRPTITTPANFDFRKYAAEGDFPGSLRLPGTNISLQVGGFTQLDVITDSNAIGSQDSFIVSSIPTDIERAGQTSLSARQTRLFVKTETPTKIGPLVTYVEGDFFGPDGTDFRLRHGYGEIGGKQKLLAGQTWTTFMDASTYPAIFDYQGPNGMVLVRQPILRYTMEMGDAMQWQASIEDPNPDISTETAVGGRDTSVWPDIAANFRWAPKWGHVQVAGILRELTFDPDIGSRERTIGWGLNFSGHFDLFDEVAKGKRDNVVWQVVVGEGIESYINDTSGLGLDGFFDAGGDLDALFTFGGFVAYQHYWNANWGSSLGYSYLNVDNADGQAGGTYEAGHYVVANVIWYPADRVAMGLEGLYGIREDQDGDKGDDLRLSFSVQYRF